METKNVSKVYNFDLTDEIYIVDIFFMHEDPLPDQRQETIDFFIRSHLCGDAGIRIQAQIPISKTTFDSVEVKSIIRIVSFFLCYNMHSPIMGGIKDNTIVMIGDTAYFIISVKDRIYQMVDRDTVRDVLLKKKIYQKLELKQ